MSAVVKLRDETEETSSDVIGQESTFISALDVPHHEQQCRCADAEKIHLCPGADACLPGTCADKTTDFSHSCPSDYEERAPAQSTHTTATGRAIACKLPSTMS